MDCTSEPKVDPSPDEAACERLTDGDAQRAMFSHSAHWGCLRTLRLSAHTHLHNNANRWTCVRVLHSLHCRFSPSEGSTYSVVVKTTHQPRPRRYQDDRVSRPKQEKDFIYQREIARRKLCVKLGILSIQTPPVKTPDSKI